MNTRMIVGKKSFKLRPAQQIALSFLGAIIIGTILLALPISHTSSSISLLDHFFIATSAVCVTGLTPQVTVEAYTLFGQSVILILMQLGGLGLMTFIAIFLLAIGGRLAHSEKLAVGEAVNRSSMADIGRFIRFIITYTLIFEILGMILLSVRFVPIYGWSSGFFKALFISVSAFCNAGFDVIGRHSLQPFVSDVWVNLIVTTLIIMGGLGFSVWFDLTKSANSIIKHHRETKRIIQHLQVHVKLVLFVTGVLLVGGWLFIFVAEFNNPLSLGSLGFMDKIMASFFQSTTLRTAGFSTLDISSLRPMTLMMMFFFMFIGGSPGGTAGGVKTTTIAIIVMMVITELTNRDHLVVYKRNIDKEIFRRAFAIVFLWLSVVFVGIMILTVTEQADFIVIVFEAFSAMGTVGLSMGITPHLTSVGKVVIIILMFIGRIGPIALAFTLKSNRYHRMSNTIEYPSGHVIVG